MSFLEYIHTSNLCCIAHYQSATRICDCTHVFNQKACIEPPNLTIKYKIMRCLFSVITTKNVAALPLQICLRFAMNFIAFTMLSIAATLKCIAMFVLACLHSMTQLHFQDILSSISTYVMSVLDGKIIFCLTAANIANCRHESDQGLSNYLSGNASEFNQMQDKMNHSKSLTCRLTSIVAEFKTDLTKKTQCNFFWIWFLLASWENFNQIF